MSEINDDEVSAIRESIRDFVAQRVDEKSKKLFKDINKLQRKYESVNDIPKKRKIENQIVTSKAKFQQLRKEICVDDYFIKNTDIIHHCSLGTHTTKQIFHSAKEASLIFCDMREAKPLSGIACSYDLSAETNIAVDCCSSAGFAKLRCFFTYKSNGITFFNLMLKKDKAFETAIKSYKGGKEFYSGLKNINLKLKDPSFHRNLKQLYFPILYTKYHIIVPLYPSALIQSIDDKIHFDLFSAETKQAKRARQNSKYCIYDVYSYPNIAIQTFGGNHPENISQLNSERGGKSYLLPSLPPSWQSPKIKAPRRSVFLSSLYYRKNIRYWVEALGSYLKKTIVDNINTRHGRDKILNAIVDDILNYALELRSLPSGWSDSPECQLPDHEKKWLDPGGEKGKSIQDEKWLETVCHNFALTLNSRLKKYHKVEVDNLSYSVWKNGLEKEMKMFRWELCDES